MTQRTSACTTCGVTITSGHRGPPKTKCADCRGLPRKILTRTGGCSACGAEFLQAATGPRKKRCPDCNVPWRAPLVPSREIVCRACGVAFEGKGCRKRCPLCTQADIVGRARPCLYCDTTYTPTRRTANGYCSPACGNRARLGTPRANPVIIRYSECEVCGIEYRRSYADQRACGRECGRVIRGQGLTCSLKQDHPVMRQIKQQDRTIRLLRTGRQRAETLSDRRAKREARALAQHAAQQERATRRAGWEQLRECTECAAVFVPKAPTARFCSKPCGARYGKRLRKGRERGWSSCFTWAEFMHLFLLFDRRCAYCEQPIGGQPEPDHVVALSRGGPNSITNILPSCHMCNADKGSHLLSEWNADRERRGKPLRAVAWSADDPRFKHLILFQRAGAA